MSLLQGFHPASCETQGCGSHEPGLRDDGIYGVHREVWALSADWLLVVSFLIWIRGAELGNEEVYGWYEQTWRLDLAGILC